MQQKHTMVAAPAVLLAAILLLGATQASALDVPPLSGRVNDHANMISPQARQQLERQLAELEASDSTQVVVLTVPSLEGDNLESFSIRVVEAWKLGRKDRDNGVLFLASRDDRKMRIEVGYGLEGVLTDVLAGRILDLAVKPRFKTGDFDGGFLVGVQAIGMAVRGEFKGTGQTVRKKKSGGALPLILLPLAFIVFSQMFGGRRRGGSSGLLGLLFLSSMLGNGRGHGSGGGFGDGGFGGFSGGGGGFGGGGASGDW